MPRNGTPLPARPHHLKLALTFPFPERINWVSRKIGLGEFFNIFKRMKYVFESTDIGGPRIADYFFSECPNKVFLERIHYAVCNSEPLIDRM